MSIVSAAGPETPDRLSLRELRDDGWLSTALGRLAAGAFAPLLPAVTGSTVAVVLLAVGIGPLGGVSLLAPVAALLLAGVGAAHAHDGRWDWAVPLLLRGTEYLYVLALGFGAGVPLPLPFALVAALAARDWARGCPSQPRGPDGLGIAMLGWDGRMLVLAVGGMLDALPFAFGLLAGYLWVLNVWAVGSRWLDTELGDGRAGHQRRTPGSAETAER
ncbi:DUF5941 domain-containing protein [Lipingzhangella sp. LS1_29]|uniref:DUF5941 domain-containing protein n=1 Tax=Lipingzhangella rawalii TaxID=2055835 RepID=A0ABU2H359_9ACTN|nr:DUF5941 domain-containing protein [Lipingzhangella rawalii]MDS1269737.1 DUF5941 domain-containing protein [Lipingzhangella rawalii]